MERVWNLGLRRPLGVQSFLSCPGNLEDNVESRADDGGLACEDPKGT